jgi:hypothetical protein
MDLSSLLRELSLAYRAFNPCLHVLPFDERQLTLELFDALSGCQFYLVGTPLGHAWLRRPIDYVLTLRDVSISHSLAEVSLAVRAVHYILRL